MDTKTITRDLPCIVCGYNLRGISLANNCPECSHPLEGTWIAARSGSHPDAGAVIIANRIIRDWLTAAANAAGLPLDGFKFVRAALKYTKLSGNKRDFSVPGGANAAEICAGVRKHAQMYFDNPDEARDCLSQWRIRSSEDVGAIVFALVEAGILKASPDDSLAAFNGLFTFEDLIGGILEQAEPA